MEYYDDNDQQDELNENTPGAPQYSGKNTTNAPSGPIYKQSAAPKCRPENGPMARFSLFCGILGCLCLFCFFFPAAIALGIVSISLAMLSRNRQPLAGMAIAGLICGTFSLVLGAGEFFFVLLANNMLRNPEMAHLFDQFLEEYGYTQMQ